MGSGGKEIMREGENLIVKMLVSHDLTQKQNEKFPENQTTNFI